MGAIFSPIHASKENQIHLVQDVIQDSKEIQELKQALMYYPNDYNLYIELGKAYNLQFRYREAIQVFSKAIQIDPICKTAYRNRASRYINTLQFNKAYKDFSYCDSLNPHDLDNIYRMSIIKFYMGKYAEAVPLFEEALKLTKDDGEMGIGMIYWYILNCVYLKDEKKLKDVCNLYSRDMYVGHHLSYQRVVELFCGIKPPEDIVSQMEIETDDLEHATTMYGVYVYYKYKNDLKKAKIIQDALIKRDEVWPCLAYIAAYNDMYPNLADNSESGMSDTIPIELENFFKNYTKVAVAFSGGVDSSYLLYAAKECGCEVKGFYVKTQFQPAFELRDAIVLSQTIDVPITIINADSLESDDVSKNPYNRCYFCKQVIFSKIIEAAQLEGYKVILDGTNASDEYNDRPGMKAVQELKVLSPLRVSGLTKNHVRKYSKKANLFTWDKPSYACLATRIPTGIDITPLLLNKVENAENYLATHGFKVFRVRILGTGCKIELSENDMELAFIKYREIRSEFYKYFEFITLDLNTREDK